MTKFAIFGALTLLSTLALAQTPPPTAPSAGACQTLGKAKHSAREALHACIENWAKDEKPSAPLPTEDCSNKLVVFIQAAKEVKACHQAIK